MSGLVLTGVRPLGGDPVDIVIAGDRIVDIVGAGQAAGQGSGHGAGSQVLDGTDRMNVNKS